MKKLSEDCYVIRNAKRHMSASSLKVVYYAFFTQLWAMKLYFWETPHRAPLFVESKKKQLELWKGAGIDFSSRNLFKK